MRLNHLDLLVRDIPDTVRFMQRYFQLTLQTKADSPKIAILTDGHGFVLVLQHCERPGDQYPEGFHLGFLLDSTDEVRTLQLRARDDGTPVSDVIVNARGTIVYLARPEGFYVEVSCQNHQFA